MRKETTQIYAYPIDRFDRNVEDKVIVEAYESMENDSFDFPVLKMTPSELAEKINDEIFNDQEYWLRTINPMQPAYCQREEQLRREIISEIITTLRNEGMNTITFSNISENRTEMIWFDRHGFTSCSRIETVEICGAELKLVTEEGISLYTGSDYGADDTRALNSLLGDVSETIKKHYTTKATALLGAYLNEKGYTKIQFDHRNYESEFNIPTLVVEGKSQKVKSIEIDTDGTIVKIETEAKAYIFFLSESKGRSLSYVENSLREAGLEDVLEATYHETSESKDEPFDFFIHKRLKDEKGD